MDVLGHAVRVVFVLGAATWVGGLVLVVVVVRAAHTSLDAAQRVGFFQAFGRLSFAVLGVSFVLAVGTGAWLLRARPWDAAMVALVVGTAALVLSTLVGVVQARAMTRSRRRTTGASDEAQQAVRVAAGARRAVVLRALIVALTFLCVVLGVTVTTG